MLVKLDATGGIILVGGASDGESFRDKLFQLRHADGRWIELPQKLKTGRHDHEAMLVPDEITKCTEN